MSIVASRLRNADDDSILAENTDGPFTPSSEVAGEVAPGDYTAYAEVETEVGALQRGPSRDISTALFNLTPTQTDGLTFTRASVASYIDADGVLQQAAVDELRNSHHVGGEQVILLEEARTQRLLQSQDLAHSYWNKQNTTVQAEASEVIGGKNQFVVTEAASGSATWYNVARSNSDVFGGTDLQVRYAIVKDVDARYVTISSRNDIPQRGLTIFDLQAGSVVLASPGTTAFILPLGGGWYIMGFRAPATTDSHWHRYAIGFASPDGTEGQYTSGTGGRRFIVAHTQAEVGSSESSPILTEGSTVTRAADVPDLSGVSWASQETTRYERRWSLATQDWEEVHDVDTRTGPASLDLGKAYTHVRYEPGSHSVETMRQAAGV